MASPPPLVPPLRFSMVEEGVYRGAYPSQINLRFLSRLGLRSMVSLLPEQPAPHLITWCEEHCVRNHAERVASFREEVSLTQERIAELLQLLVLPERQPVYVHCLDGVSVTGTLIMCLRKLQRWAPSPYFAEYARIARDGNDNPSPPAPHVLAFVNAFKPELELARLLPPQLPTWLAAALGGASMAEGVAVDAPHLPPHKEGGLTAGGARGVDASRLGGDEREHSQQGAGRRRLGGGGDAFAPERDPTSALPSSRIADEGSGGLMARAISRDEIKRTGVSSALNALAIEGLTMGPFRAPPTLQQHHHQQHHHQPSARQLLLLQQQLRHQQQQQQQAQQVVPPVAERVRSAPMGAAAPAHAGAPSTSGGGTMGKAGVTPGSIGFKLQDE